MIRDDSDAIARPSIRRPGGRLRRLPAARWRSDSSSSSSGRRIRGAGKASITTTTSALLLARGEPFPDDGRAVGLRVLPRAVLSRCSAIGPGFRCSRRRCSTGSLPWLVFAFARTEFDERVAVVAARADRRLLVQHGLRVDAVVRRGLHRALHGGDRRLRPRPRAAAAGAGSRSAALLAGIAPQFRPNLILVPLLLAGVHLLAPAARPARVGRRSRCSSLPALVLTPWIVRNYRLTGDDPPDEHARRRAALVRHAADRPVPAQPRLQPALGVRSAGVRLHEPRRRPADRRGAVEAVRQRAPTDATLTYWSDRDATPRTRRRRAPEPPARYVFEIPAARDATPSSTTTSRRRWPAATIRRCRTRRPRARARRSCTSSASDHLGDLDVHGDLLDVFDVVRLARHEAWNEPLPFADKLRGRRRRRASALRSHA